MTLLERLETIQEANGLSDRKFAIKLGISGVGWSNIRKAGRGELGGREIGVKVLAAILTEYPDMKPYVLEYIMSAKRDGRNNRQAAA